MRFLAERTQFLASSCQLRASICCRTRCFSAVFSAGGACGGARRRSSPSVSFGVQFHRFVDRESLLQGSPPLSGASVLSASRWEPLAPFPLPSPARFSRSVPEPDRASRCLHAGCRSVGIRTSSELVPQEGSPHGFDNT